jgi:uncharacterized protein
MPVDTALDAVRRYIDPEQPAVVEFAGGEPFLAFPNLKQVVESFEDEYPLLRFAIQTNAAIFDRQMWQFLIEKQIGIGISLDGVPKRNDVHRGFGAKVVRTLLHLDTCGVGVNITAVLTRDSIVHMEEFLLLCGSIGSVRTINLDVLRPGEHPSVLPPTEKQIIEMVEKLFEVLPYVNQDRFPPLRIREIEQVKSAPSFGPARPFCYAGDGKALAVTPAGELYPCPSFAGIPQYLLGSIGNERFSPLRQLYFSDILPKECTECEVRFVCRGGCPSRRVAFHGRPDLISGPECVLYREIYKKVCSGMNEERMSMEKTL